jgi:hypothetical protein
LNITILSLSADFTYNNQSGTNSQGQSNQSSTGSRQTFRVGPALTFRLAPTILYGVSADATRSTGLNTANVNSLNFGGFIKGRLTKEFEFDLNAGISLVSTTPAVPPGYYFSAAARYQIDKYWQVIASASHQLVFTTGTDLTEQNLFQLGTQLNLTRLITFTLAPFVNFGNNKPTTQGTVNTFNQGNYTLFGVGASLAWKPRNRWSTALSYNYARRESEASAETGTAASQNYIQNTWTLSVSYAF